jgi:hypothetical protein
VADDDIGTNDALDTNDLSLSGDDAALFHGAGDSLPADYPKNQRTHKSGHYRMHLSALQSA